MAETLLLCVDIGNTNTVLGIFKGKTLQHHLRIESRRHSTVDEYAALVHMLLHQRGLALSGLQQAVIGSVVPQLTPVLRKSAAAA